MERQPHAIPVTGAGGQIYDVPFGGGLNTPRFQFVDADGDLDLDLFILDVKDRLTFYRNRGTPESASFVWVTDEFEGIKPGTWFRFGDLNGDGNVDLLTDHPFNQVAFFRGAGPGAEPQFSPVSSPFLDDNGQPVISETGSVPALADPDCDSDLDYFASNAGGTITQYENLGNDLAGVPRLSRKTDSYGSISLPDGYCGPANNQSKFDREKGSGTKHGAAVLTFFDIDANNQTDLFWGDAFTNGVLLMPGTGSCAEPSYFTPPPSGIGSNPAYPGFYFPSTAPAITSGLNFPAFADIDADGDFDFFASTLGGFCADTFDDDAENFLFFESTNAGWIQRTRSYLSMLDVGKDAAPVLFDIDGDADLDLIVGNADSPPSGGNNFGRLTLFRNDGTRKSPSFVLADEDWANLSRFYLPGTGRTAYGLSPAFADIDGDGDADLFVGFESGEITFFRRSGDVFDLVSPSRYASITVGNDSVPTFGDLDNDGDLDLIIGNRAGKLALYRNAGTALSASFQLESDFYLGLDIGSRAAPSLFDTDSDGDLDLFVGAEAGNVRYFRNDGSASDPLMVEQTQHAFVIPEVSHPVAGDIDDDGDTDVFVGIEGGGIHFFQNQDIVSREREDPAQNGIQPEVWPNPTRNMVFIRPGSGFPAGTPLTLTVFDVAGREVKSANLISENGTEPYRWDFRESGQKLSTGFYLLRLTGPQYSTTLPVLFVR